MPKREKRQFKLRASPEISEYEKYHAAIYHDIARPDPSMAPVKEQETDGAENP